MGLFRCGRMNEKILEGIMNGKELQKTISSERHENEL
jgi:hypothetical protein